MRKRGPGRPRNQIRSETVSVQVQVPLKRALQRIAQADGLALATWLRTLAIRELSRRNEMLR